MHISFTKMQGLGNDFVVFNATTTPLSFSAEQIRFLADRHFGIGCDQVLLVEATETSGVDFRYRIFNADGGEVEQCGNGARCFARFVREKGLTNKDILDVETKAGRIQLRLQKNGEVTVDMGPPHFLPRDVSFIADEFAHQYSLTVDFNTVSVVSMGNPHMVFCVKDIDTAPVTELGKKLSRHPHFSNGINVGFMQVIDASQIRLRVYERGVGETLACGTGACAAAVVGQRLGFLNPSTVTVKLLGGRLTIAWDGRPQTSVLMTGSATFVFEGNIEL
jgi:diaminopimelate epimerase